jgi:predicted nucleic acid-binding protein
VEHYVVDASIAAQHLIHDSHTPHVDALFDALSRDHELYIPDICLTECANVLWKRVRFHGLEEEQAVNLIHEFTALPLTVIPSSLLLASAIRFGVAHQMSVYDAIYIALAKQFGYSLITADQRQSEVAKTANIELKLVTDFPPLNQNPQL